MCVCHLVNNEIIPDTCFGIFYSFQLKVPPEYRWHLNELPPLAPLIIKWANTIHSYVTLRNFIWYSFMHSHYSNFHNVRPFSVSTRNIS